jgi:hypothetical protein
MLPNIFSVVQYETLTKKKFLCNFQSMALTNVNINTLSVLRDSRYGLSTTIFELCHLQVKSHSTAT